MPVTPAEALSVEPASVTLATFMSYWSQGVIDVRRCEDLCVYVLLSYQSNCFYTVIPSLRVI